MGVLRRLVDVQQPLDQHEVAPVGRWPPLIAVDDRPTGDAFNDFSDHLRLPAISPRPGAVAGAPTLHMAIEAPRKNRSACRSYTCQVEAVNREYLGSPGPAPISRSTSGGRACHGWSQAHRAEAGGRARTDIAERLSRDRPLRAIGSSCSERLPVMRAGAEGTGMRAVANHATTLEQQRRRRSPRKETSPQRSRDI